MPSPEDGEIASLEAEVKASNHNFGVQLDETKRLEAEVERLREKLREIGSLPGLSAHVQLILGESDELRE